MEIVYAGSGVSSMIVNCEQMRAAEERAFKSGISADTLMESAGRQIADVVMQFYPEAGRCVAFCGKGHNGGDALVALRYLKEAGWDVSARLVYPRENLAALTHQKLNALGNVIVESVIALGDNNRPLVLLDGILGIGGKGTLRDPIADAVVEINTLRKKYGASTIAIDIPTGLDSETGTPGSPAIVADCTVTIGYAKSCLLADAATGHVGRLALVHLEALDVNAVDPAQVATPLWLSEILRRRSFDMHKGECGRLGIIAGSRGFLGAARLCSAAATRGGAGLVTLYVTEEIYPLIVGACHPEVMVHPVSSYRTVLEENLDALAIGPGVGFTHAGEILSIIRDAAMPVVVDADALTILSRDIGILNHCAGPRLLTPHPGEMERLQPRKDRSRREWAEDFAKKYPVTLLLKGARTLIAERNHPSVFNTTGHPGMATGGMGDILTGVCGALLAQGHTTQDAAALGAWTCGRAAEHAVHEEMQSGESLVAGDLLPVLGMAFRDIRAQTY